MDFDMQPMQLKTFQSDSDITISLGDFSLNLRIANWTGKVSELNDFALWIALPFAMSERRDLIVEGPVSKKSLINAARLVELWTIWAPTSFSPIEIHSREQTDCVGGGQEQKLMCFSGGVDSTFALARNFLQTGEKVRLLTVHGMDYRKEDHARFQKLLEKTAPARERFSDGTISVWSNVPSVMKARRVNVLLSFGFNLAGALFLFEDQFKSGAIAADNPIRFEVIRMPYGSNSISNPLFDNGRFCLETWGLEASRSEKIGFLAKNKELVSSLSFCKDYSIRPENCGVCPECIRAKALFFAETGQVPDVFLINGFKESDLTALTHQDNFQIAGMDIIWSARRNGRSEAFENFQKLISSGKRSSKIHKSIYKMRSKLSARMA